jgi:hypothetical protein
VNRAKYSVRAQLQGMNQIYTLHKQDLAQNQAFSFLKLKAGLKKRVSF